MATMALTLILFSLGAWLALVVGLLRPSLFSGSITGGGRRKHIAWRFAVLAIATGIIGTALIPSEDMKAMRQADEAERKIAAAQQLEQKRLAAAAAEAKARIDASKLKEKKAKWAEERKKREAKEARRRAEYEAELAAIESASIGISPYEVESFFESTDIPFTWQQGVPIDGHKNYVGTSPYASIQIIGSATHAAQASVTSGVGWGEEHDLMSVGIMYGFCAYVSDDVFDWVVTQMGQEVLARDLYTDREFSAVVGRFLTTITYNAPIPGMMGALITVSIEVAGNS